MAEKLRYTDEELEEFKSLIEKKLEKASKELDLLQNTFNYKDSNSTDDTSPTFKLVEDGSEIMTREEIGQLAVRQKKFIQNLEAALTRIQNKTYGICRETGKLIQKERLLAVPHATLSMEAKLKQNK
ncbi:MAG: TraR/DksA family transcriptional regulator [Bacteroidia bacterium]|nr:TraR/DksA family transcriptional regulator [Bacteroidia bacterium]